MRTMPVLPSSSIRAGRHDLFGGLSFHFDRFGLAGGGAVDGHLCFGALFPGMAFTTSV